MNKRRKVIYRGSNDPEISNPVKSALIVKPVHRGFSTTTRAIKIIAENSRILILCFSFAINHLPSVQKYQSGNVIIW